MNAVDFFNDLAEKTNGILSTGRFFSFAPFLYKRIFSDINGKIAIRQDDFVLDIGGGTGELTRYFSKICRHIVLADGAETSLNVARQKLKDVDNISYVTLDITKQLPFAKERFNKIICYSVIHYMEHSEGLRFLLRQLLDICVPNGTIFIGDIPLAEKYKQNLNERRKHFILNFICDLKYFLKRFITQLLLRVKKVKRGGFVSAYYTKEILKNILDNCVGIEYSFLEQDKRLPFASSREDLLIKKVAV